MTTLCARTAPTGRSESWIAHNSRQSREKMKPSLWLPSVELSTQEEHIMKRIHKAKLFLFLRQYRNALLDEAFQHELANLYRKAERGQPPVAPAMLALALILEVE
jgi:hypothetical protein